MFWYNDCMIRVHITMLIGPYFYAARSMCSSPIWMSCIYGECSIEVWFQPLHSSYSLFHASNFHTLPFFYSHFIIVYLPPTNLNKPPFLTHLHIKSSPTELLKVPLCGIANGKTSDQQLMWDLFCALCLRCTLFSPRYDKDLSLARQCSEV